MALDDLGNLPFFHDAVALQHRWDEVQQLRMMAIGMGRRWIRLDTKRIPGAEASTGGDSAKLEQAGHTLQQEMLRLKASFRIQNRPSMKPLTGARVA